MNKLFGPGRIGLLALALVSIQARAQQIPVRQGLVAYYPMDGDATDLSMNQNHGRLYGGVSETVDRHGRLCGALTFNGSSGYIEVPSSSSLSDFTDELTLSAWVRLGNPGLHGIEWLTLVCKGNTDLESFTNPHYRVQVTSVTLSLNTDMTENISLSWRYGQWYHVAVVYDGRNAMLFRDGQRIVTVPYVTRFQANSLPLYIGRDEPGRDEFFDGALDDLRLYNRALRQSEITQLYNDQYGAQTQLPAGCSPPPRSQPPTSTTQEETPSRPPRNNTPQQQQTQQPPQTTPAANANPAASSATSSANAAPANLPFDVQDTIVVTSPDITITLYDHRKRDGDIVSVAFNGVWIANQIKLRSRDAVLFRPPSYNLTLLPNQPNYLISKAWNEGSIPPNTLRILVEEEGKRDRFYTINSTPMQDGAVMIRYEPQ